MKILQINKHAWPHYGGIEKVVQDISSTNDRDTIKIDVLCLNDSKETLRKDDDDDDEQNVYRAQAGWKILGMPISWDFFKLAKQLLPNYDLIILHHPFPLGFLVFLLYGRSKPMIVWYHSDIVRQKLSGFLIRPLINQALKLAKKIVVSHRTIANNSLILQKFNEKIFEIPFYVVSQDLELSKLDIKNSPVQILSVGRLVYYKGYEYLITAMGGVPAELLIIGNGHLKVKLLNLIEKLSLKNVRIVDPVPNLSTYYKNCDIFVLPSVEKSEAFGLVQLEAMAWGKPVINTHLPTAVPTVSIDQITGLTVAPKNIVALQEAIMLLVTDLELRQKYGTAAKIRAEQEYSFEKFTKNLEQLISDIKNSL